MPTQTGINSPENFDVLEFDTSVSLLAQQTMSRFRNKVTTKTAVGEGFSFNQVGSSVMNLKDTRHGETPIDKIPSDRRWIHPDAYETADLTDWDDQTQWSSDPSGQFVRSQAASAARTIDETIITAGLGTSRTGKSGATNVALPSSQIIVSGSTGLTVDKLRTAKNRFLKNDVDLDVETLYGGITPDQLAQLEESVEYGKDDYNALRPLMDGKPVKFLGIDLFVSTRLPNATDTTGLDQQAMLWVPSGLAFAVWKDVSSRVDPRPDRSLAEQLYTCMQIGATRSEEVKVMRIDTAHS